MSGGSWGAADGEEQELPVPRSQGTPGGCQRLGAGAAGSAASAAARLCLAGGQAGGTIRTGRCQRRSLEAPRPPPWAPKNSGDAGVVQDASKRALSPRKTPRSEQEAPRGGGGGGEEGGWDPPTCISRASSPLQPMGQAPASFPPEAAGSGCEPRAAVGCKPLSGSAACRGSSGLGCSRVPPRTGPAARAGARPPQKPRAAGTFARLRPQRWHAGTRGGGGGAAELLGGRGCSACTTESVSEARAARLRNLTNIRPVPPGLSPPPRRCALPARATRQGLVPSPRPRFGASVAPRGALG